MHDSLTRRALAPDIHLVDTGYVTARGGIAAQLDHDVELVGPMMPDASRQSRAKGGYPASAFTIDWDNRQVTCPSGKTSRCIYSPTIFRECESPPPRSA